jgi:DNA polymerase III subunit gamma/tau
MSYQVLARKWRPKVFAELMGQEHVVRALTHALDSGRIHHAFLFTGTRGVGKTTIARIFAKSLNCETGITSTPCGICSTCLDIAAGRFFDLLEIDAASNTGVDDVRSLIENAQYAPARGRMKVYLIDEVHMLSKSAFNALLKTLEEPPEHVKFLLATTDPQRLPVTVLSRCLQFNLKRLSIEQIEAQINKILLAEEIAHDAGSVREIARCGNGSLRDALSLLDQAIAFGGGKLAVGEVQSMLGTLDRGGVIGLLDALVRGDGDLLAQRLAATAEFQPDYGQVLDALAECLHGIQVAQLMPGARVEDIWPVTEFVERLAAETVQLFYQLAIAGRRDLHLAPSARIGFEMCLLRMLAFQPRPPQGERVALPERTSEMRASEPTRPPSSGGGGTQAALAMRRSPDLHLIAEVRAEPLAAAASIAVAAELKIPAAEVRPAMRLDAEIWAEFPQASGLRGPAREFASNLAFIADDGQQIRLGLADGMQNLQNEMGLRALRDALGRQLGREVTLMIDTLAVAMQTPALRDAQQRSDRQIEAERSVQEDPFIQRAIAELGARILANTSKPIDPKKE